MNKPSVGGIVHYTAPGSGDGVYPQTCRAAIVTEVVDSTPKSLGAVHLMVINTTGIHFREDVAQDLSETSFLEALEGKGGHTPYTWHWPEGEN